MRIVLMCGIILFALHEGVFGKLHALLSLLMSLGRRLFVFPYQSIEPLGVRKNAIVFLRGIFTKAEGGDSHGFGIVLNGERMELAENRSNPNR